MVRTVARTAVGFLLAIALLARSQDLPAKCTDDSANWTFNQKGVSPCDVAASLNHECFPGDTGYPALLNLSDSNDNGYGGPDKDFSNKCDCSTVQYSLIAACALCQKGEIDPWQLWSSNCNKTDLTIAQFPLPFNGQQIPVWAFFDITADNQWLASKARLLAGTRPDLTDNPTTAITIPSSTTITTSSSSSSTTTTRSSRTSSSTSTSGPTLTASPVNGNKSNAGAIAGGVVGGVLGLALIGAGAFFAYRFFMRKKGASPPPPQMPMTHQYKYEPYDPPRTVSGTMGSSVTMKLYDPSDPSTFPPTPFAPPSHGSSTGSPPPHPDFMPQIGVQTPLMGYKGMPEV